MPRKGNFKTKISKARFVVSGLTSQQMVEIGAVCVDSIKERLSHGQNVSDTSAKPLSAGSRGRGYRTYKARRSPPAVRNWRFTGRTLRAMRVLRADENKAVIGFSDPIAAMRAAINNRRERQFGISPASWRNILAEVEDQRVVRVEKLAA